MKRSVGQSLRRAFLTGLLVLVPFAVTAWVLIALVGFLEGTIRLLPDAWQPARLFGFPVPGLGLLLALGLLTVVGFLARSYAGRRVVRLGENLLARVPIANSIYSGVKQLMESLFASDHGHFRKVVLIHWPMRGSRAIAFHTGRSFIQPVDGRVYINVFMPSTPNPTTGFYLVLPEDEVVELGLTVEEAFKLIMSAGMVAPFRLQELEGEGGPVVVRDSATPALKPPTPPP